MWILSSTGKVPPGGFIYQQDGRKWVNDADLFAMAKEILSYRQGNGLPGATLDEVLMDISTSNAERLGHNKRWCMNTDRPTAASVTIPKKSGGCCGARVH